MTVLQRGTGCGGRVSTRAHIERRIRVTRHHPPGVITRVIGTDAAVAGPCTAGAPVTRAQPLTPVGVVGEEEQPDVGTGVPDERQQGPDGGLVGDASLEDA
jgi:hypothetical protein